MGARRKIAPVRVVLDTNLVLSALVFAQGKLVWLRQAWQAERIVPLASRETVIELARVLSYPKFKLSSEEREELLADYLPWCETVVIPAPAPVIPECRDPNDVPFLRLALAAGADALVTGDADLLALAGSFPLPILRAEQLRQSLWP